jgi:hypothetical protein
MAGEGIQAQVVLDQRAQPAETHSLLENDQQFHSGIGNFAGSMNGDLPG